MNSTFWFKAKTCKVYPIFYLHANLRYYSNNKACLIKAGFNYLTKVYCQVYGAIRVPGCSTVFLEMTTMPSRTV